MAEAESKPQEAKAEQKKEKKPRKNNRLKKFKRQTKQKKAAKATPKKEVKLSCKQKKVLKSWSISKSKPKKRLTLEERKQRKADRKKAIHRKQVAHYAILNKIAVGLGKSKGAKLRKERMLKEKGMMKETDHLRSRKRFHKFKKERRYVHIGRIVLILHGSHRNTIAVIVDIVDNHYVMIDGKCIAQNELGKPSPRKIMNMKDLHVTPLSIKIPYRMRAAKIAKVVKKARILQKWKCSTVYNTIQKRRAKRWSTDLERWRVQYNRRQRSALIKAEYLKLKRKVLELARAATISKELMKKVSRTHTLPSERNVLKRILLDHFKPEKKEKKTDHPLDLIPKKETKKKADKKPKEESKAKPTAKPSSKKGAKPKPKAKGKEASKAKGKEQAKPKEQPKPKEQAKPKAKEAAKEQPKPKPKGKEAAKAPAEAKKAAKPSSK